MDPPFNYFNLSSSARHGQPPGQPGQPNNQDYWQNPFQAMGMDMGMGMMGMGGWNLGMAMGNSMHMPQMASGFNFTPMPKLELPNMNAQFAPAQTTVRPTPSAAAGSQQQLDEAVVASAAAMPVKKVGKRERNEDDDDTSNATSSVQSSKRASKLKKKTIMLSETEDSDLEAADSSDEDFVKKTKGKINFSQVTKVTVSEIEKMLKNPLKDLIKGQSQVIRNLEKSICNLKKNNEEMKINLKTAEGDPNNIIDLSSDEEEEQKPTERLLRGFPMSFAWDDKDKVSMKITKSDKEEEDDGTSMKITENDGKKEEVKETYDWTAEEAKGTFDIPEDDYGYILDDFDPKTIPFIEKGTIVVEDLKCPCRACKIREAIFEIHDCKHVGLCAECVPEYKNSYKRCPGCGDNHVIFLERVYLP